MSSPAIYSEPTPLIFPRINEPNRSFMLAFQDLNRTLTTILEDLPACAPGLPNYAERYKPTKECLRMGYYANDSPCELQNSPNIALTNTEASFMGAQTLDALECECDYVGKQPEMQLRKCFESVCKEQKDVEEALKVWNEFLDVGLTGCKDVVGLWREENKRMEEQETAQEKEKEKEKEGKVGEKVKPDSAAGVNSVSLKMVMMGAAILSVYALSF